MFHLKKLSATIVYIIRSTKNAQIYRLVVRTINSELRDIGSIPYGKNDFLNREILQRLGDVTDNHAIRVQVSVSLHISFDKLF